MNKPKKWDRMMQNLERAMELAPSHASTVISDAAQALHKAIRIAEAGPEWERVDLSPTDGPRTGFMGRSIWQDSYSGKDGRWRDREVFETPAGALVALSVIGAENGEEGDRISVHVAGPRDDAAEQRAEIMAFWRWDDGAMRMARKLGWNIAVWVD